MASLPDVVLGENLTFGVCTHDPDTGVLTDAETAPTYEIYAGVSDEVLLSGSMTKRKVANAGRYVAQIACTEGNGFAAGIGYTIEVVATVDGDSGGLSFNFAVNSGVVVAAASKTGYKLASDGLDSVAVTVPTGVAANFREMVVQLWRRFFGKATMTSTELKTYGTNGSAVLTTQTLVDDATTQTQGEAS